MHPEYVRRAASPGSTRGSRRTSPRWPTEDGLAQPGVRPTGLPWQEPDGGFAVASGRTDLFDAVDTEGRTDDRRSDFSDVYGDWDAVQRQPRGSRRRFGRRLAPSCTP